MSFSVTHLNVINLFADDLDRTKAFYREVLGLTLVFEDASHNVFKLENLIINLIDLGAAHELISPARVANSDSGARAVLSVFVDDVDAVCAELADRGVELMNGPLDRPWGVRTASFTDPAGHIWEVGPGPRLASATRGGRGLWWSDGPKGFGNRSSRPPSTRKPGYNASRSLAW